MSRFHFMHIGSSVVRRLDYYPGSIPAGAKFPTGIQFWVMTWVLFPAVLTSLDWVLGRHYGNFSVFNL